VRSASIPRRVRSSTQASLSLKEAQVWRGQKIGNTHPAHASIYIWILPWPFMVLIVEFSSYTGEDYWALGIWRTCHSYRSKAPGEYSSKQVCIHGSSSDVN
jgi:hypothetical protein